MGWHSWCNPHWTWGRWWCNGWYAIGVQYVLIIVILGINWGMVHVWLIQLIQPLCPMRFGMQLSCEWGVGDGVLLCEIMIDIQVRYVCWLEGCQTSYSCAFKALADTTLHTNLTHISIGLIPQGWLGLLLTQAHLASCGHGCLVMQCAQCAMLYWQSYWAFSVPGHHSTRSGISAIIVY